MAETRNVVIIGGGHNGLIAAFYLAQAGLKPLVLERRPQVGGCAITSEFHPGFRCSTLAHATGPVRAEVDSDMKLESHGLRTYVPEVRVLSLDASGKHLALYSDTGRTQQEVAKFSTKEAAKYAAFQQALASIAAVIDHLMQMTPPDIDDPASSNVWDLLKTGRKIRGLGDKDLYRLLRWAPAAADLVGEWFENELLRGTIGGARYRGTFLGPWSAGSSAAAAAGGSRQQPRWRCCLRDGRHRRAHCAMAIALQAAAVEIRTSVEVSQIKVKGQQGCGSCLSNGDD